jgi:hypothetical protein
MSTVGGLVVPWLTPRTADGRWLLGRVLADRVERALHARLCGVCGRELDKGRLVLLMRLSDLHRQRSFEPGLHPVCAKYTADACPMVAGRLDHYRPTPARLDATMIPDPDTADRQGAAAPPWFAVWVREYEVIIDNGNPAASYAGTEPVRIRPLGRMSAALLALKDLMSGDPGDGTEG